MLGASAWLIIGIACIGILIAFEVAQRLLLRSIAGALTLRVRELFPTQDDVLLQDLRANFFGVESAGGMQVRGNGVLLLTRDSLEFLMFWPQRRLSIPLAEITGTSLVRSHCGKTIGRDLLRVEYTASAGEDAAAWYLPDARSWQDQLDAVRLAAGSKLSGQRDLGRGGDK
ncbi:MAG: hypothetical protein RL215_339 [Planctomycetota bacterium]|jgi:hypothetical protein